VVSNGPPSPNHLKRVGRGEGVAVTLTLRIDMEPDPLAL